MTDPVYFIDGCAAENLSSEGVCSMPVVLPYPQPVLPPLDLADGSIVSFAVISMWALGLKAKLVFRAARQGY
jgi:hypothetical protein